MSEYEPKDNSADDSKTMEHDNYRATKENGHKEIHQIDGDASTDSEKDGGHGGRHRQKHRGNHQPPEQTELDLDVLQIASSQMEFFQDQVRILEAQGVGIESLSYPPDPSHTEGDIRRKRLHEGILRKLHGHNALYYAYRAADFYPHILKTAMAGDYDIVHLNSGMIAPLGLLQPERPIVLTLWGDDILGDRLGGYQSTLTKLCARRCDRIIVRNQEMKDALPCDAEIIPSGIDMQKFRPVDRSTAQAEVGWDDSEKHVLFPYSKTQTKKRYPVAKDIVDEVDRQFDERVRLQVVDNVPHEKMYLYYNAADALLLPSLREGSPNTVKEAMACNVPVVSTDVGDVAERLGPVANSYVCLSDARLADALVSVLETGGRSDGREAVEEVSLERMGERLIAIYEELIEETES